MSVIMVLRMKADADALERFANTEVATMNSIADAGRADGCLRHSFAAGQDGEVLVVDEWVDEEAFHKFFAGQADVPRLMAAAGVQGAPEISFYRRLDVPGTF